MSEVVSDAVQVGDRIYVAEPKVSESFQNARRDDDGLRVKLEGVGHVFVHLLTGAHG